MGYDTRIRVRCEWLCPSSFRASFRFEVVLYDPVVNDGDIGGCVRVGIALRGNAVGRPPGVGQSHGPRQSHRRGGPRPGRSPCPVRAKPHGPVVPDGYPRRIVTTVLKRLKASMRMSRALSLPDTQRYRTPLSPPYPAHVFRSRTMSCLNRERAPIGDTLLCLHPLHEDQARYGHVVAYPAVLIDR